MKEPFRYSIRNSSTSYYAVVNKRVNTVTTPVYFYTGVINWEDIVIKDIRNWRMSGYNRSYIDELKLANELGVIVRHIWAVYGGSAKVEFIIERLNDDTQEYEAYPTHEIDFSVSKIQRKSTSIVLKQSGIQALIKDKEDVEYAIDVDTNSFIKTITINPFLIKGKMRFLTIHQEANAAGVQGNIGGNAYNWFSLVFAHEEYTEILNGANNKPTTYAQEILPRAYLKGQQRLTGNAWAVTSGSYQNFMYRTTVAQKNARFQLSLPVFLKENSGSFGVDVALELWIVDENTANSEVRLAVSNTVNLGASGQGNYTLSIDHTEADIPAEHRLYFLVKANSNTWEYNWEKDIVIKVDYEYYTTSATVKGISYYKAFEHLIREITSSRAVFESDLLRTVLTYEDGVDCDPSKLYLLSGDSVKGVSGGKIKVSLKDLLKSTDAMLCAGLGLEYSPTSQAYTVRVERKDYFFNSQANGVDNLISALNKSTEEWVVEEASDITFSELHIGYPEIDKDELNGAEEFNTTLKMTSVYTNGEVLDMISPIHASGYYIYRTWVKYASDPEADNGDNNKLFVLQITYDNGWRALYPTDINSTAYVTGITDTTTALNIGLSPMRCVIRNAYWLMSHIYDITGNNDPYTLTYQTLDRNTNLESVVGTNNGTIVESSNANLNTMVANYGQTRVFYPIYLTYPTDSKKDYRRLMLNNKFGIYSANIEGYTLKGYPMETTERGVKPKVQEFKLLLNTDNDIAELMSANIYT